MCTCVCVCVCVCTCVCVREQYGPHHIIPATHAPPREVGAASCRRRECEIGENWPAGDKGINSRQEFPSLTSADAVAPPCIAPHHRLPLPPPKDTALELDRPSETGWSTPLHRKGQGRAQSE